MIDQLREQGVPESLGEFVVARARRASDAQLVLCVAAGIAIGTAVTVWAVHGWPALLSAAICLAAFGVWGITDRELGDRIQDTHAIPRALRASRMLAALVGWLALIALAFSVLGIALGTIIS